ncbi:hypothetical protein Calag_0274 [Caldisphaera lagunensis DSM 15908]|uniref:SRPBCC family protein n=1 Tax=Caldisphaera lagunensis (strain DSM 15908 / JCM 11604 / ANMR 0165 / IC-154) TaxID=1056495 RepID=L0A9F7_CALLD|nr:hypothetical protein [Caldisphaera lagunensis]AFZ70054.1 hypothetical protein Calag_0274 [Caldisphaera lagunensis DSM 15908]
MVYFRLEKEFNKDSNELWKLIADIKSIPKYWHGHKSINIIHQDNNTIEAIVEFVFPSKARVKYELNEKNKEVISYYLDGPFKGKSILKIDKGKLINEWDIKFNGIYKFLSFWEVNHFKKGSEDALNRIVNYQISNST